uniref:Uncharacterized protein n=1 Tax=Steinernema glaseri TaxID=37863 RepID=A0A1I7ZHI5_9BILA
MWSNRAGRSWTATAIPAVQPASTLRPNYDTECYDTTADCSEGDIQTDTLVEPYIMLTRIVTSVLQGYYYRVSMSRHLDRTIRAVEPLNPSFLVNCRC